MKRLVHGSVLIAFMALSGLGYNANAVDYSSPMGVNFWFFADYMRMWPFVDFFKTSRPFWAMSDNGWGPEPGVTLNLDTNGYPKSLPPMHSAATLMFWGGDMGHHPPGNYTCLYDGSGTIEFAYNARVVSSAPGRIVVFVDNPASEKGEATGVLLKITKTDPANPVRNIRFIAPGFEATYKTQIFHPLFLERLKPFRVLRFMDWMDANKRIDGTWASRNKPTSATQQGDAGVCLEHLIQLCNRLDADPYFNLPCTADDNYIRKFAEMVRDSLKPNLRAYIEYGNEVWNWAGGFECFHYCDSIAKVQNTSIYSIWSRKMVNQFKIFESVFGSQVSSRLVRVGAIQMGYMGFDEVLKFEDAYKHVDVMAVAPYFGPSGDSVGTVDQVIKSSMDHLPKWTQDVKNDVARAKTLNLPLIAYEGGLWLMDEQWHLPPIYEAVHADPRMASVYKAYLDAWKSAGATMFIQYTYCDDGWGLLKFQNQSIDSANAYKGAVEWIAANPRWWTEADRMAVAANKPVNHALPRRAMGPTNLRVFSIAGQTVARATVSNLPQKGAAGVVIHHRNTRVQVGSVGGDRVRP